MLKIASYSLRGQVVRVKLKCTCGNNRVLEVHENQTIVYFCGKCRARRTLDELKKDASSYWRLRGWVVESEPDQRAQPRVRADFPVELTVKASRYSPAYCVLHGRCAMISASGMLAVVEDFQEAYFQDITSAYRFVDVTAAQKVESLPVSVTGRIVGVRYRAGELPQCRIGIAFEGLTQDANDMIGRYIHDQAAASPAEGGDRTPPIDNQPSLP